MNKRGKLVWRKPEETGKGFLFIVGRNKKAVVARKFNQTPLD